MRGGGGAGCLWGFLGLRGRTAEFFTEYAAEIKRIGKADFFGDRFNAQGGVFKQPLSLVKLELKHLCGYIHLQKAYLCTVFKNHMQMSIGEYIRLYRVNIAKNLLLETEHKAEDIAAMSGFYDIHHFSRTFKQIVGINPSEFRKNNNVMPKKARRDRK